MIKVDEGGEAGTKCCTLLINNELKDALYGKREMCGPHTLACSCVTALGR